MDEMMKVLECIGMPADQCARIRAHFDGDLDGLTRYVLYCIAALDDRHEYVD